MPSDGTMDRHSYFKLCLGHSYTPIHYGLHEGVHPQRVREAMATLAGRPEADVIAALVHQHEVDQQRFERLLADYQALQQRSSPR